MLHWKQESKDVRTGQDEGDAENERTGRRMRPPSTVFPALLISAISSL
jgi:hypothetical protein